MKKHVSLGRDTATNTRVQAQRHDGTNIRYDGEKRIKITKESRGREPRVVARAVHFAASTPLETNGICPK